MVGGFVNLTNSGPIVHSGAVVMHSRALGRGELAADLRGLMRIGRLKIDG